MDFYYRDGRPVADGTPVHTTGKRGDSGYVVILEKCRRCGGAGGYRGWPGFTCFDCGGNTQWRRERRVKVYTAKRNAQLDKAAATRAAKKAAAAKAERDARLRDHLDRFPEATALIGEIVDGLRSSEWVMSMAAQYEDDAFLTQNMADAIVAAHQRYLDDRAKDAAAEDTPEGRHTITGEILSAKIKDSAYGSTYKMLVRDDRGFKVWGTIPNELQLDENGYYSSLDDMRGLRVTFTATISPEANDPKFGFFKRPTKPARLPVAEEVSP